MEAKKKKKKSEGRVNDTGKGTSFYLLLVSTGGGSEIFLIVAKAKTKIW